MALLPLELVLGQRPLPLAIRVDFLEHQKAQDSQLPRTRLPRLSQWWVVLERLLGLDQ